jgi:hypothetical protein
MPLSNAQSSLAADAPNGVGRLASVHALGYGGGHYLAVGKTITNSGNLNSVIITSSDGLTWSDYSDQLTVPLWDAAYFGGNF